MKEYIKTFDEALHYDNIYVDDYLILKSADAEVLKSSGMLAYIKLRIICEALNDSMDDDYPMLCYYPKFSFNKDSDITYSGTSSILVIEDNYPSYHLYLKSKELAEYCGRQFINLWKDFYC